MSTPFYLSIHLPMGILIDVNLSAHGTLNMGCFLKQYYKILSTPLLISSSPFLGFDIS
jgi:hypothetical protein